MDPRFTDIAGGPENKIFQVVFFPDRVYHAQYLNATRSRRYGYVVDEVRGKQDITLIKGRVELDGNFYTNFIRIEYRSPRLVEATRERNRLLADKVMAWIKLNGPSGKSAEATVKLHLCRWTDAYQVEIWQTMEPPAGVAHDATVIDQMGRNAPITRVRGLSPLMDDLKAIKQIEVAFREDERFATTGFRIGDVVWDNSYGSTHQEPRNAAPNSSENTVEDKNYLLDFQRGRLLDFNKIEPVRYQNAMMDGENRRRSPNADDNVTEMRWGVQRQYGSTLIFNHVVTINPGVFEGVHQHIGSEETYFVFEGRGILYMGESDDPNLADYPLVEVDVFGLGRKMVRKVEVYPGCQVFTKSGGIHGIENPYDKPLRFYSHLYHSV